MNNIVKGLEGLEVDDTEICLVDGTAGQLSYRGQLIETLVERPFVDVVSLVVGPVAGDDGKALADELRAAGALTEQDTTLLRNAEASGAHPMHILMGLTPLLRVGNGVGAGAVSGFELFGDAAAGFCVAAKLPALIAGLLRLRTGKPMIDYPSNEPDSNTRFLIQAGTAEPSDLMRQAFDVTQILQIEHSFNASTFTARVIASTLADVQNSLAGGFAALHGPLHGGADQAALYRVLYCLLEGWNHVSLARSRRIARRIEWRPVPARLLVVCLGAEPVPWLDLVHILEERARRVHDAEGEIL